MTPAQRIDKPLIWTVASSLMLLGVAWGRLTYQSAEHERRISEIEKQLQDASVVCAQMKFFLFYKGTPK